VVPANISPNPMASPTDRFESLPRQSERLTLAQRRFVTRRIPTGLLHAKFAAGDTMTDDRNEVQSCCNLGR